MLPAVPGFLLRRVIAVRGFLVQETREREGENEPEMSNAVWFDFEANEMGAGKYDANKLYQ